MKAQSSARASDPAAANEPVVLRENVGNIVVLTLNRPQARNSLSEAMLEALRADPQLSTVYEGFAPRPSWRPVTLYERRAIAAGRTVFDLEFRRDAG